MFYYWYTIKQYLPKPTLDHYINRDFLNSFEIYFLGDILTDFQFLNDNQIDSDKSSLETQSIISCDNEGQGNNNTNSESQIKDGIEGIIGGINGGSNGGGDSSPAIHNIGIWFMIKSITNGTICKICEVFDRIMQFIEFSRSSVACEYILGFIGCLYDHLGAIPSWFYNIYLLGTGIIYAYKLYCLLDKACKFDILYRVPAFRYIYTTNNVNFNDELLEWTHLPQEQSRNRGWSYAKNNNYGFNRITNIMRSLGLVCINKLELNLNNLNNSLLHYTSSGAGLKALYDIVTHAVLIRVSTLAYDPKFNHYVYAFFNILVYSGVGVVVWYKYIPGDLINPPDGFLNDSIEPFKDPTSVVEGYKRVSYLVTKNIIQTVITTYMTEHPFKDILTVDVFNLNDPTIRGRVACVGTGIMMAIFLTTKVLVPVATGVIQ